MVNSGQILSNVDKQRREIMQQKDEHHLDAWAAVVMCDILHQHKDCMPEAYVSGIQLTLAPDNKQS